MISEIFFLTKMIIILYIMIICFFFCRVYYKWHFFVNNKDFYCSQMHVRIGFYKISLKNFKRLSKEVDLG